MSYPVFLDANVLFSKILLTVLLDMAEAGRISFLWSGEVLQEVGRNLKRTVTNSQSVDSLISSVKSAFAQGEVLKVHYQGVEANLSKTDPKDRHVLAAAAVAGAYFLVTFNLSDFDVAEATTYGVHLIDPDSFLCLLLKNHPNEIVGSIKFTRGRRTRPPQTEIQFLSRLKAANVTNFANELSSHIGNL
jgi:predicted nucleic acid-binding protein